MRYYPEHQIKPAPIEMPAHVDTFEVNKMLHFEQITALLDISIDQIRDLNPQYIKDVIPGQERTYVLRLPFECSGEFAAREQEIYSFKDSVYFNPLIIKTMETASDTQITHRVRNGETLSNIAGKYGVRIADIKYWNGLRSDRIVINQRLIIHTNRETAPRASDVRTASASSGSSSSSTQENLVRHKVRPGETLGGIAEKYSVSAANIRLWNNLRGNTIYAGKTLKIYSKGVSVTSTDDQYEYYTVRSGDNLWGISKKLGVSVDDIRALNGFGNSPKIFPGQKIKVKKI
jgi:membrane-bound lytic murein transglycosylase D